MTALSQEILKLQGQLAAALAHAKELEDIIALQDKDIKELRSQVAAPPLVSGLRSRPKQAACCLAPLEAQLQLSVRDCPFSSLA
jgi:hypothetical protein